MPRPQTGATHQITMHSLKSLDVTPLFGPRIEPIPSGLANTPQTNPTHMSHPQGMVGNNPGPDRLAGLKALDSNYYRQLTL